MARFEPSQGRLAVRGLAVAALAVALLVATFLQTRGYFNGSPVVTAKVRNAGASLTTGSDVKMRGVLVGRVRSIEARDGEVDLSLRINDDQIDRIPENVVARILPATIFGTTYLDLSTPATASGTAIQAGAVIPADTTQETLELQEALDDIDRLIKALGPGELNTALSAAAVALDGRGKQIGRTLETANDYVKRLNPRMGQARKVVGKLADNLEVVNELAPDLFDATDAALVTARTIVEEKASITNLLTGSNVLTTEFTAVLTKEEERVVKYVNNSAYLMKALYDTRSGLTTSIESFLFLEKTIPAAVENSYVDMAIYLDFFPPEYYGPQDCPQYGRARGNNCVGLSGRKLIAGAQQ